MRKIFVLLIAISLIMGTVVCSSMTALGAPEPELFAGGDGKAYQMSLMSDFNNLGPKNENGSDSWNGTGTAGTATYQNENGVSSMFANWGASIDFYGADAPNPSGKMNGSYLPVSETDKAVYIGDREGTPATYSPWFRPAMPTNMHGSKVKLSLNVYMDSVPTSSAGIFQGEIRYATASAPTNYNQSSNLFSIRNASSGNPNTGNLQIAYRTTGGTPTNTTLDIPYTTKQWHNIAFIIDTTTKTFTFYLNGVPNATLTDVALHNSHAYDFPGIASTTLPLCGQFGFSGSNNVKPFKYYIDDLFIGKEVANQGYSPTFLGTAGEADNGTAAIVPKDLRTFKVSFPSAMNEESLKRYVTLTRTRGADKIPVGFTGEYNSGTREYTVTLNENARPNNTYTLTFDKGVRTASSAAMPNVILDTGVSFSVSVPSDLFEIENVYFTESAASSSPISSIESDQGTICGNVDIAFDNRLNLARDVTLFVGVYKETEHGLFMEKIYTAQKTINPPIAEGPQAESIKIEVNLNEFTLDENYKIGAFVWNNYSDADPMTETVFANVVN